MKKWGVPKQVYTVPSEKAYVIDTKKKKKIQMWIAIMKFEKMSQAISNAAMWTCQCER